LDIALLLEGFRGTPPVRIPRPRSPAGWSPCRQLQLGQGPGSRKDGALGWGNTWSSRTGHAHERSVDLVGQMCRPSSQRARTAGLVVVRRDVDMPADRSSFPGTSQRAGLLSMEDLSQTPLDCKECSPVVDDHANSLSTRSDARLLDEGDLDLAQHSGPKWLKRGNFCSLEDLQEPILAFLSSSHQIMAHPFKWTSQDLPPMFDHQGISVQIVFPF